MQNTITPGRVLRCSEAAELLGVNRETVRRLVKAGEIAAFRVGQSVRIPAEEIDRIRSVPAF